MNMTKHGAPSGALFPKATFYGVQALRAVAALLVVVDHAIYLWLGRIRRTPNAPFWTNGASGVDIFFVISGFVMVTSLPGLLKLRHPVRRFLSRRIVRIVPLYWLATTLKLTLLLMAPGLTMHSDIVLTNVLGSYLFVPTVNPQGHICPVVVVGWTLNFEMFFYLMFSFAMLFKRRTLAALCAVLTILAFAGLFYKRSWPTAAILASPILFEFLMGAVIARLSQKRILPGSWVSWTLLLGGFSAILALDPGVSTEGSVQTWRFLIWGVPAAAIVLGAVGLERRLGQRVPKMLVSLGNASYAIYLVQTFALPFTAICVLKLGLSGQQALAGCIAGALLLSAVAGEIVHRYVEVPILARLKGQQQRGAGFAKESLSNDAS